jgi:hypothetical protein
VTRRITSDDQALLWRRHVRVAFTGRHQVAGRKPRSVRAKTMRSRIDAGSEALEMCSSHILGAAQVLIAG